MVLHLVWLNPNYWAPFSLNVGQVPYGSHKVNFFPQRKDLTFETALQDNKAPVS